MEAAPPSWSIDYGMAWHGPMDLPSANHLAAYFIGKKKEREERGEIDERVSIDDERQHDLFDRSRLERRRLQIKGIIWVLQPCRKLSDLKMNWLNNHALSVSVFFG